MNATELQALRRLLFLTQQEAASMLAGVSHRAWVHWEAGARPVPDDVAAAIRELAEHRETMLDEALAAFQAGDDRARSQGATEDDIDRAERRLVWYTSPTDWTGEPLHWFAHRSTLAGLLALDDRVRLVPFDGQAFEAWLGGREDSQAMRAAWVNEVPP